MFSLSPKPSRRTWLTVTTLEDRLTPSGTQSNDPYTPPPPPPAPGPGTTIRPEAQPSSMPPQNSDM